MGNRAFGAGKNQGIKEGIEIGKKVAKEALKNEKIATAAGTGLLGLIVGAIIKGLSK